MKKSFKGLAVLLMVCMLLTTFLTACSNDKPGAAGGEAADKEYSLRLATVVNPPHPWVEMAEYFAEELEKRTDGKVKVTVYPSAQLGSDETTIDEMRTGTIDFIVGGAQNAASFIPQYQAFGLAYLFTDDDHFENTIAHGSPVFNRFAELYEEKNLGIKLLGLSGGGVRNVSNNLRPITTPADLQGMRMRLPGSPMEAKLWEALGAIPTSLPWSEIYTAIQTGVVSTFESTISGYNGSKLYEVAKYHSETQHLYMLSHFSMSQSTFDKLPEDYQKIVQEVAIEASLKGTEIGKQFDKELLVDFVEKYGVEVNKVDTQAFMEIVQPLHDELAEDIDATDILQMIRDLQ
ncbi:TRAP transporter substrate-binding protein [Natronincola ferrireducens]|uniref:Extracellular solute-binding protein, family 7 n=1 Tax=Natronincola ferrireducens TaxID=393762 RepID=A0A1G9IWE9_9FIRM|nr:TRAP transporter substrate-binding protein [Natronincola ferrireducens]SDL29619.1 extracellular solute-binding protein, family 7 [Natronincola ferrireducens]